MFSSKTRRQTVELNASSMADIAFLLLIFFLVSTTINVEKGLLVLLPDFTEEPPPPWKDRNILNVKINFSNQIMVEGEATDITRLRFLAKQFILNPDHDNKLAESPNKAIVSLQNDRSTSYKTYVAVYNEVKAAYNELWEQTALHHYGASYESLSEGKRRSIKQDFPMIISESELTDLEKE